MENLNITRVLFSEPNMPPPPSLSMLPPPPYTATVARLLVSFYDKAE
jgi:hypothetical protein